MADEIVFPADTHELLLFSVSKPYGVRCGSGPAKLRTPVRRRTPATRRSHIITERTVSAAEGTEVREEVGIVRFALPCKQQRGWFRVAMFAR